MKQIKRSRRLRKNLRIPIISVTLILGLITALLGSQAYQAYKVKDKQHFVKETQTITTGSIGKIHADYPITKMASVDTFIKHYVDDTVADFNVGLNGSQSGELNIKFDAYEFNERYLSVIFDTYSYIPPMANGQSTVSAFTFDMTSGNIINLNELFASTSDYDLFINTSYEMIQKMYNEQEIHDTYTTLDSYKTYIDKGVKFSLTQEGLNLHFDKYDVFPGYMGVVTLNIEKEMLPQLNWDSLVSENTLGKSPDVIYEAIVKEREAKYYEDKKLIALTFDDGPHAQNTEIILDILKKYEVPATFFVLGQNVERYPELVVRAHQEGHQIASHTFNHFDLAKIDTDKYEEEINNTEKLLEQLDSSSKGFVRPPYGSFSKERLQSGKLKFILWDVDTMDWKLKDSNAIVDNVINGSKDGSIVLMHDIYKTTAESVEPVILKLKEKGYTFVTVEKLLEIRGGITEGKAYYKAPKS